MTIDDREVIEALRNEPELLALADAVHSARNRLETPPPLRPGRARLRPVRVAAVGLALTAALVLLLVSPWDSGGPSLVDRALAAVGNKPVLHTVIRYTIGSRVDLLSGRSTPLSRDGELWYDAGRGVFRSVTRIDGRVVYRASGRTTSLFAVDDPAALGAAYREALIRRKVRQTGTGVLRGRRVVFIAGTGNGSSIRAALDAQSFQLVRLQFLVAGRLQSQLDVLRYETVSRAEAKLPNPPPGTDFSHATTSGSGSGSGMTLGKARTIFASAPLWVGRTVDGRELGAVTLEKETDTGRGQTVHGKFLAFDYGSIAGGDSYLELDEAPAAIAAPIWTFQGDYAPPPGYLDLTSGQTGSGPHTMRTQWTGLMQKDGFYVRLISWSKVTLVTAARALRPLK
jgi:hypothetical protein